MFGYVLNTCAMLVLLIAGGVQTRAQRQAALPASSILSLFKGALTLTELSNEPYRPTWYQDLQVRC